MRIFSTCLIADRMDSGPCDLCRSDRIQCPVGRHASCTGKNRVGHSPTQRKEREMTRINRGALFCYHSVTVAPQLPGPTIPEGPPLTNPPAMWRPTRAPTWTRPLGLLPRESAPPAPRVGQPWLCHVASVPRRIHALTYAPRQLAAWALSPRHHLR